MCIEIEGLYDKTVVPRYYWKMFVTVGIVQYRWQQTCVIKYPHKAIPENSTSLLLSVLLRVHWQQMSDFFPGIPQYYGHNDSESFNTC